MGDGGKGKTIAGVLVLLAAVGVGVAVFLHSRNGGGGKCSASPIDKKYYLRAGGKHYMSMAPLSTADPKHSPITLTDTKEPNATWRFYTHPTIAGSLCLRNMGTQDMFFMAGPGGDTKTQAKVKVENCSDWEAITVECLTGADDKGKVAIKSHFNTYLGVSDDKTTFVSTATTRGEEETFELIPA